MMNLMVMNSAVKFNILKTFIVYVKKKAERVLLLLF